MFQPGQSANPGGSTITRWRKLFNAAIVAESKVQGISLMRHAVRQAYGDNTVLAAVLKKILPDLKAMEVTAEHIETFKLIVEMSAPKQLTKSKVKQVTNSKTRQLSNMVSPAKQVASKVAAVEPIAATKAVRTLSTAQANKAKYRRTHKKLIASRAAVKAHKDAREKLNTTTITTTATGAGK